MHDFIELVDGIKAKVKARSIQNETSVRFYIVDPILRYLGWNDPSYLELEQSQEQGSNRPNYTLKYSNDTVVIIETRRMGFDFEEGIDHVIKHRSNTDAAFIIITDGNIWKIYDNGQSSDLFRDRVINQFNIERDDTIKICNILLRLKRCGSVMSSLRCKYREPLIDKIEKRVDNHSDCNNTINAGSTTSPLGTGYRCPAPNHYMHGFRMGNTRRLRTGLTGTLKLSAGFSTTITSLMRTFPYLSARIGY